MRLKKLTEQKIIPTETLDKVKNIVYKQDLISKIALCSIILTEIFIVPLIYLVYDSLIGGIFVLFGIIFFFMLLVYIYRTYSHLLLIELAGWENPEDMDTHTPRFEITFEDGYYCTNNLVRAIRDFSERITSIKIKENN